MHRIDVPSATFDNKFTEGSPTGGVPATIVPADWLNDLQENVCEAIEGAGITLVSGDAFQLLAAIQSIAALSGTPGLIGGFGRSTAPTGWLKANGAAVSRSTYSALFAAIGVTFGAGNGTTTFNLPDLRAEFIRGLDDGRGIDTGRTLGSFQVGSLTAFDETTAADAVTGLHSTSGTTTPSDFGLDSSASASYPNAEVVNILASGTPSTVAAAAGISRPRNIALLLCIKY